MACLGMHCPLELLQLHPLVSSMLIHDLSLMHKSVYRVHTAPRFIPRVLTHRYSGVSASAVIWVVDGCQSNHMPPSTKHKHTSDMPSGKGSSLKVRLYGSLARCRVTAAANRWRCAIREATNRQEAATLDHQELEIQLLDDLSALQMLLFQRGGHLQTAPEVT